MISHGGNYTHWAEELKVPLEKVARENEVEWGLFLVSLWEPDGERRYSCELMM